MDYTNRIDAISMNLANSADRDEMQLYAAFHPGLHCLSEYSLRGFLYTKG